MSTFTVEECIALSHFALEKCCDFVCALAVTLWGYANRFFHAHEENGAIFDLETIRKKLRLSRGCDYHLGCPNPFCNAEPEYYQSKDDSQNGTREYNDCKVYACQRH